MKFEDICGLVVIGVLVGFAVCVLLYGCGGPIFGKQPSATEAKCPSYGRLDRQVELWGMTPRYDVRPTVTTPSGIRIDPSNNLVDVDAIDELVRSIDDCMYEQFGRNGGLYVPKEVLGPAQCMSQKPKYPVDKTCLTIKVAELRYGCSDNQILKWKSPNSACTSKGLEITEECPCYWRSGMQDGHTVVTTPDFYLFADWYIRVSYGCLNPWGHPATARCAQQGRL